MIVNVSSFLFNVGVCLFILGFVSLFYIKYVKIAILNLVVANLFFATAMAFSQKVIAFLDSFPALLQFMDGAWPKAMICGLVIYALLFVLLKNILSIKKDYIATNRNKDHSNSTKDSSSTQQVKNTVNPAIFANVGKKES